MDKRTRFIAEQYSVFWQKQVLVYGFCDYHRAVLGLLEGVDHPAGNNLLLECGIGTGWPLATGFSAGGWEVYGIDIGFSLLQTWQKSATEAGERARAIQGDVHFLPYPNDVFNVTCCFQATWLFSDLARAIDEMFRVTIPDGWVIFDIMNHWNWKCLSHHLRIWARVSARIVKRRLFLRPIDDLVVHEWGTTPFAIARILHRHPHEVTTSSWDPQVPSEWRTPKWNSARLLYVCRKR